MIRWARHVAHVRDETCVQNCRKTWREETTRKT